MLIHVACPNCSEPYDIADTFAGGVYRCSKCNTLMSVPKKHTPPPATNLAPGMSRAASPDAIESRGSSQPSKASSSARSSAAKPAAKSALKPGQKPAPAGLAAYKWHLMSLGGLVLLSLLVFAIVKATQGKKVEETIKQAPIIARPESNYVFPYALGVLTNAKPNVLGLPLTGNVAVIVDGTSDLNGVRPALHKLLAAGLTGKPYEKPSFSVYYANGDTDAKLPVFKTLAVNAPAGKASLDGFLAKVAFLPSKREDPAALKAALKAALDQISAANPTRHIVLVVGRSLSNYAQNQLVSLMADAGARNSTRFDLVVVDADASAMTLLTEQVAAARGKTAPVSATLIQTAANAVK